MIAKHVGIIISMSAKSKLPAPTPSRLKKIRAFWTFKKIVLALGLLLLAGIIATLIFLFTSYRKMYVQKNVSGNQIVEPTPEPTKPRPFTIALLGYGGGAHQGGKLTDSILVAKIDQEKQRVILISVPRDLWVPLEVEPQQMSYWKINAAYAIGADDNRYKHRPTQYTGDAGGGEMAKNALSTVVGFPIDHFLALDFMGFQKTVDVLGGVDIKVEKTFDDNQYPIEGKEEDTCGKSPEEIVATLATVSGEKAQLEFPCRFEQLHFDRGVTHMDGTTALKYVRSRHGDQDGGDFGRAARQRNLILAVKKRVLDIGFISKIIPFISTISSHLKTDVSIKQIDDMLEQVDELKNYSIVNVALTDKNVLGFGMSADRQSILIPKAGQDNWDDVHSFIESELNKEASSSAAVTATASTSARVQEKK